MEKKFKYALVITILLVFIGCVPMSDYKELEDKNNKLKEQLYQLRIDNQDLINKVEELSLKVVIDDNLKQQQPKVQAAKEKKKHYTEEQAKGYVDDYYSFYRTDYRYRNVQIRRIDENKFVVSVEEMSKVISDNYKQEDTFWDSKILDLVINIKGDYSLEAR